MDKSIYKKMRRLYLTHPEVIAYSFRSNHSKLYFITISCCCCCRSIMLIGWIRVEPIHWENQPTISLYPSEWACRAESLQIAELSQSKRRLHSIIIILSTILFLHCILPIVSPPLTQFESKLSVALRAMNYAFNRKTGQLNTIDQCSDRLLQDVCVANFAMTFHESIQSDRMEFDWQRALDSMKLHNKLILMLKGERETFQPTTPSPPPWSAEAVNGDDNEASPIVIATEDDEIHVISDDASEENSRSATPIPTNGMNRDDLNVRKRSAEQSDDDCEAKHSRMMGESSNVSENKLSIDKEETGTRDLTVDISCVVANNDDQREKRTIEMVTKFRGGKIIIEINWKMTVGERQHSEFRTKLNSGSCHGQMF